MKATAVAQEEEQRAQKMKGGIMTSLGLPLQNEGTPAAAAGMKGEMGSPTNNMTTKENAI